MKTITIEELLQLDQNTITVLDVRPADAYIRGSVPGAVSIPLAEVEERMEELPKEKPVTENPLDEIRRDYAIPVNGVLMLFMNWKQPDMMRRILKADIVPF